MECCVSRNYNMSGLQLSKGLLACRGSMDDWLQSLGLSTWQATEQTGRDCLLLRLPQLSPGLPLTAMHARAVYNMHVYPLSTAAGRCIGWGAGDGAGHDGGCEQRHLLGAEQDTTLRRRSTESLPGGPVMRRPAQHDVPADSGPHNKLPCRAMHVRWSHVHVHVHASSSLWDRH